MNTGKRTRSWAMKAAGIGAFALIPSIALGYSTGFDSAPVSIAARGAIGSFTPASIDPRLAEGLKFTALRGDRMFRFTPAGATGEGKRALTIAVRINPETSQAINIRPTLAGEPGKGSAPVQITPTAFNLGVAKGFQKFALPAAIKTPDAALPDLADIGKGDAAGKSRFSPRIELDQQENLSGRNRVFEDQGGYQVDLGGAYKVTRNLDVTAGIRLRSERERLAPLTNDQVDSQAVYVGTEFRF